MAKRKNEDVAFDENENVEVTETELEEGAEKAKKKREPSRRTILTKEIVGYLFENVDDLPEELASKVRELKSLPARVGRGGRGEGKPSIASQLKEMILSDREIHEDVFYEKFKLGRLEMKRRFYNMRKKVSDPNDAVWVSFDPETGIYRLEGTGAEPPANWVE